jgi:O-antigen/teichoic acid export membrane protein
VHKFIEIIRSQKSVSNAASVLANDVVGRASTFILYALIARRLGTYEFGQLSLALTLYATFQVLAVAGLKTLATREIANDRARTNLFLVNGMFVVSIASVISIGAVALIVSLMRYPASTQAVIVIMALSLFPYSLSAICEAVFQGWERMHYIAVANVPANVAKVALAALLLYTGKNLQEIVLLLLACQSAALLVDTVLIRNIIKPRWRISAAFGLGMLKKTATFLGIDCLIAVMGSTNLLLVSKLASQQDAGLYNAATQMLVPIVLIYQNIAISVFPAMCRHFGAGPESLSRIAGQTLELLLAIAIPTTVGIFLMAEGGLSMLYGSRQFLAAAPAVRVLVWTLLLTAVTNVLGPVLIASLRERVTLGIVSINLAVSLVLGFVLIQRYGLVGAAATALVTRVIDFTQHYIRTLRILPNLSLWSAAWKPALATAGMTIYLVLTPRQNLWLTVGIAACLYSMLLLLLFLATSGGPDGLKARFLNRLPE